LPEAILIYDPWSKDLAFANAELHKLLSKYSKVCPATDNRNSETERNMMEETQKSVKRLRSDNH